VCLCVIVCVRMYVCVRACECVCVYVCERSCEHVIVLCVRAPMSTSASLMVEVLWYMGVNTDLFLFS
jgi:hypothetical protein